MRFFIDKIKTLKCLSVCPSRFDRNNFDLKISFNPEIYFNPKIILIPRLIYHNISPRT